MKKRNYFISIGILFLLCLLSAQNTFACSCFPLPPIYQAFDDADAVFVGKVVGTNEPKEDDENYDGRDVIFDFEVIENFKGAKGKTIKLNRGTRNSSCYSGYTVGETYLVYAYNEGYSYQSEKTIKEEGFVYQGSFCNRTANFRSAQDQIYFIREKLSGKPESQFYGSLGRSDADPVTFAYRHNFLEGIKIVIEGDKNRFETLTDKNGLYKFNNIPEGDYIIKPAAGENYIVYFPAEEKIKVLPDKTVASDTYGFGYEKGYSAFYAEFTLGWNNRIDGRVVDSQGKPFDRYVVGLLPLSKADAEISPYKEGSPDHHDNGAFWEVGETPGKYVLAVDVYAPFGTTVKKRFFYPQAESIKDAKIFDLTATTKLKDIEIKLPYTIRDLTFEFYWTDGTPSSKGGWVTLNKLENENDKNNTAFDWNSIRPDDLTIQALEGFEYWISATIGVEVVENGKEKNLSIDAKPQKIKIGKENAPVKLVFEKPKNFIKVN